MTGFVMFIHTVVAALLAVIILMQSGRGGGLTESFASAESMFGARTNEFMVKATTVFSCLFLVTCLGLAVLSSQKSKSLMSGQALKEAALPAVAVAEPPQVPSDVPDFASIEEDTAAASTTGQPAVQAEIPVAVDQPQ